MVTVKRDGSSYFVNTFLYIFVALFALACLIPFVIILSASFTDEAELLKTGYWFWPRLFSLTAYRTVLAGSADIFKSYAVTITVTAIGTVVSVFFSLLLAYPLSKKSYKYRNQINFFMIVTMLFNGGMVPWYIICTRYLGLTNNLPALIIPYLFNAWNIFILKSFLSTIPDSIEESARIDGAGNYRILFSIIAPLALPGIATITLFISIMYWNDWWLAIILGDGSKLVPLQLYLMRIIQYVEFVKSNMSLTMLQKDAILPAETVRMAICILAIGPIIFAYPFFQRYLIKGMTVGSIKE